VLVPVYGFVQGDSLGLLVLAQDDETVATLCARVQQAASPRIAPRKDARVRFGGRLLDSRLTIAAAGITALDRVDVIVHTGNGGYV
jgi:hypothetical protein